MAQKKNFYAVRKGRVPGIYSTWDDCKRQVEGFAGAQFKGFATRAEAEDFVQGIASRTPAKPKSTAPAHSSAPQHDPAATILYADGACTGNPGRGGYGAVLFHNGRRTEFSGGFRLTTNNRMEMLGCLVGLRALREPTRVTVYSDSRYVVNAITQKWAVNWRKRGWQRRLENGETAPAANADLWAEMLEECERHNVDFQIGRAHV